jgi:uncharacterized protein YkwD
MSRPPMLLAAALTVLLATLAIGVSASDARSSSARMVGALNHARSSHGVRRVHRSRRLSRRCRAFASYLVRHRTVRHSRNNMRTRRYGEIIEFHSGSRAGVRHAVRAWLGSPGHRAVLLSGGYRRAGAGRATNGSMTIWVVRFARR